ncbi:hypothetical protein [Paenibacillus sp. CF384]|uniref:hypothetical protein n=1 Tax=Paenibacillus sp. CF384 TaxID=1884382 RepID=UPI00089D153A|nr:hypothetical protein [Paenibacillus sp. CF384]SDX45498.1 hypothetical protein SAMN05518855_101473 [Paenibacillus sp. CF384]
MAYSTGVVTNTRASGTAATNIVVNTRNLDTDDSVWITVQVFASVDSSDFYTAYYSMYEVLEDSYDVREFYIAGNVTYEVQLSVTVEAGVPNALMSVTGLDEYGNLVEDQRYTQADLAFITSLSPIKL